MLQNFFPSKTCRYGEVLPGKGRDFAVREHEGDNGRGEKGNVVLLETRDGLPVEDEGQRAYQGMFDHNLLVYQFHVYV
jgi:hypothetical protein